MLMSFINRTLVALIIALGFSACSTMPGTPTASVPTVPPQIAKEYKTGVTAMQAKKYKQAIQIFTSILQQYPQSTLAHTNLGLIYLHMNQLELADKHFLASINLTPGNPIAHNHRGIIFRQQGKFDQALAAYKLALTHKSDYANAHLNLAILYDIYLHDISSALQHYHQYQALTSNSDQLVAKWIIDNERRLTAMSNGEAK